MDNLQAAGAGEDRQEPEAAAELCASHGGVKREDTEMTSKKATPEMLRVEVVSRIEEINAAGISSMALAGMLEVQPKTVYHWKKMKSEPRPRIFLLLRRIHNEITCCG